MTKLPPPADFDENPEWTDADFARARPASQMVSPHVATVLVKSRGGRPAGSNKAQVTLRLDRDVLEAFKGAGTGWQSRINSALRKVAGL